MKRKGIVLLICIYLVFLLSGCMLVLPHRAKPVVSDDTVSVRLFAKDYIGKDRAQIESLLGGFVKEEYYNGGLLYNFARSDMWFWFGTDAESYEQVPADATCCFVMAPLSDAAAFSDTSVSGKELSLKLGFDFRKPIFNEMDSLFQYSAEKDGISCVVSCGEDGVASTSEDFVIYSLVK